MVQQTAYKEIEEVKTYKKLKNQLLAEQKTLSDTESKLAQIKQSIKELEERSSKGEVVKKDAIERFVKNEITQAELDSTRKKVLAMTKEYSDALELTSFSEEVIAEQQSGISKIEREMKAVSSDIWDKIAVICQDKFEKAVGDTASFLWVAMRSGGRYVPMLYPNDLPERFRAIGAPDLKECEALKTRLWNEFVGAE
ncbi:MAG: hypothetical protein DCC43_14630 [Candidatus Brocadia sp.]|nr:hypothetical protein [Candidatus Brocadia sp.]MCE7912940.1 hypothetical protein [Candidatus Brocadia sp. AMX3]MDG5998039.1 hypothetical protein [Candidatus Brocadia sp.]RIJ90766.1 MAG: hypothetical protein DCC43_14630 [Candidatus Brocadia sp.]